MTKQSRSRFRPFAVVLVAALAAAVASCVDDDVPVIVEPEGGTLFDRYVSLGNSITAGFQSGGIVDSMQQDAYPAVLAAKAGAPFGVPSLAPPGCPPPYVAPLTSQRTSTNSCGLRTFSAPTLVQNLAVPGANTGHLSDPVGTGTTLNTLILGGRTQLQAMEDANPTLVSVWIGNNDALGAALIGDTLALTPLATFQAEYDEIVTAILGTDAQDVILIGVANPMTVAPALQPGAYFYAAAPMFPVDSVDVSDNCAPFDAGGNPNPLAARLLSFSGVGAAIADTAVDPVVIDCADGVAIPNDPSDYLLDEAEAAAIAARIAAFNAYIEQQADDNRWLYVDPTDAFIAPGLADPGNIRKCQHLATATDSASFAAAVQSSCPVDLAGDFYGAYFSFDGVHPSSMAHAVIADTLAARLNAAHGISLPISN